MKKFLVLTFTFFFLLYGISGKSISFSLFPALNCTDFNPSALQVENFHGDWAVMETSTRRMIFNAKESKIIATKALATIRFYNANRICSVGNFYKHSFEIFLFRNNQPIAGYMPGESCYKVNLEKLVIKKMGASYVVAEERPGGALRFFFWGNLQETKTMFNLLKFFQLTRSCQFGGGFRRSVFPYWRK